VLLVFVVRNCGFPLELFVHVHRIQRENASWSGHGWLQPGIRGSMPFKDKYLCHRNACAVCEAGGDDNVEMKSEKQISQFLFTNLIIRISFMLHIREIPGSYMDCGNVLFR
jgi:hypothetical protein